MREQLPVPGRNRSRIRPLQIATGHERREEPLKREHAAAKLLHRPANRGLVHQYGGAVRMMVAVGDDRMLARPLRLRRHLQLDERARLGPASAESACRMAAAPATA